MEAKPDGDHWVSATRETNTMPQWAGSCWYHLRYLDPTNSEHLVAPEKEAIGEAQIFISVVQNTLYCTYSMPDSGTAFYMTRESEKPEPYKKLFHQGSSSARTATRCPRAWVMWSARM